MANTIELNENDKFLSSFMQGPDRETFARMIGFFSVPGKYLHPRELMHFKLSMTYEEWVDFKVEFWSYMVTSGRFAAAVV
jgi:hypothetical protein